MTEPRVLHRLVITRSCDDAVLVIDEAGIPKLPCFVHDDKHTADVDYINATVRARWGVSTHVLQSLHHSALVDGIFERIHELELDAGDQPLRTGLRWLQTEMPDARDRDAIALWRVYSARSHAVIDGRDWTRPGWFGDVYVWIEQLLHSADYGAVKSVVQLRAWPSSCVIRVEAERGTCYVKAVPDSLRRECAVTEFLAQRFPDVLPRVLAIDSGRRLFATAAFPGGPLDSVTDTNLWQRAAARYGRLQVECVAHTKALLSLGCGVRTLEDLARTIPTLTDGSQSTAGLSESELDRFVALVPELRRRCEQLSACGIPPTLDHGDLWPGNILVHAGECAIIDWEDVAVAHPFLSLAPLRVGLSTVASEQALAEVERAYLEPFGTYASPEKLSSTLRLAAPLSFIDMAIRYRQQRPSVANQHPWMRDLVGEALRRALAVI